MADGQLGSRTSRYLFPKIFTAFRIALDIKKLALAAVGIFATYVGWWIFTAIFYTSAIPQRTAYDAKVYGTEELAYNQYRRDLRRWNFLHLIAGPPANNPATAIREGIGDHAINAAQYDELRAVVDGRAPVLIDAASSQFTYDGKVYPFKTVQALRAEKEVKPPVKADELPEPVPAPVDFDLETLKKVKEIPFAELVILDPMESKIELAGVKVVVERDFNTLQQLHTGVKPASSLSAPSREIFDKYLAKPAVKRAGRYAVSPWAEDRGPNPYLLVEPVFTGKPPAFDRGGFFGWLLHDELKVLGEPFAKFAGPVLLLFDRDAGGFRNTALLVCLILWNLAVWGFVGGVISRLAAVEFARGEKIPISEAVSFVTQRYRHFFLAPLFPLGALLVITVGLAAIGFITGYTYFFGDIVLAGLFFPVFLIIGLVMAVVVVGLLGWPLMYPTIAIEGSDSFDALSRSYSYLYQKPWQFLWYTLVTLAYGAAVVFFVGLMGSLMVYLTQWGIGQAPWLYSDDPARDRTNAYLFEHAPTSFGWRDLSLHDSPWVEQKTPEVVVGESPVHYEFREKYRASISTVNSIGGWLVSFWLGVLFLLILGFSYSYFWTASTILYFLMRKAVDDTELDEIHMDEDESMPMTPPPLKEAIAPAPPKPGTMSLNVVEPPPPK